MRTGWPGPLAEETDERTVRSGQPQGRVHVVRIVVYVCLQRSTNPRPRHYCLRLPTGARAEWDLLPLVSLALFADHQACGQMLETSLPQRPRRNLHTPRPALLLTAPPIGLRMWKANRIPAVYRTGKIMVQSVGPHWSESKRLQDTVEEWSQAKPWNCLRGLTSTGSLYKLSERT